MTVKKPRNAGWIVTPEKFLRSEQVNILRHCLELGRASGDRYAVRNAAIIETLLGTGLRVSELCALVVGDLFLEAGSAQVVVRNGKGGRARLVPIGGLLAKYLRHYLAWKSQQGEGTGSGDAVFLSERGTGITRSAVHRIWKQALADAGLPTRWGVHSTRHSYAVEIYRRTKDLRLTQKVLGHSSPSITQIYADVLGDEIRRGVELVWAA